MGCYHPNLMQYVGQKSDGTKRYRFVGSQSIRKNKKGEFFIPDSFITDGIGNVNSLVLPTEKDVLVPCKRCIGCRLDYSRRWADRLMIELDHSKTAIFLTLTYNDENLSFSDGISHMEKNPDYENDNSSPRLISVSFPPAPTLVKRDVQLFNKRLRFHFRDKQIRFYTVGEYGDKTLRPHYHGIYYGLSLDDFPDLNVHHFNEHMQPIFVSEFLESIWSHGFVSIGHVSWQSCAYVARYNLKKLAQGKNNLSSYRGVLPEFSLMSRNPGIAGYFPFDHPEFYDDPRSKVYLSDVHGVKSVNSVSLPSYLLDKMNMSDNEDLQKLGIVNPELYAIIKEEKLRFSNDKFLEELSNTHLDEVSYLNLKERNHEKARRVLVRDL